MAFSKVTLNGTTLMDVTQKTVTANTMLSGTTALKNDGTDIVGSIASQASVTITPTTSQQVAVTAGKYTTGDVIVAPIPSNYIVPSGSFSVLSNGTYNITSYASVIVDVANTLVSEGTDVSVDGTTLIIEDGGGGSSDFSTATVTSINNTAEYIKCIIPCTIDVLEESWYASSGDTYFEVGTMTTTAILYKGMCSIHLQAAGSTVAISGDIEDDGDNYYIITGDCTITIS